MALRFRCAGCGKMLVAPFMKVGDSVRCGECDTEMEIPPDAVEIVEQEIRQTGSGHRRVQHPQLAKGATLAGRGHRFGAWAVDWLIYLIPMYFINPVQNDESIYMMALAGITLVYLAVQWTLLSTEGQTVGKVIMEIKIVEVATGRNGGFVTNVLLRSVVNGMIAAIPLYRIADALFILRDDRRCLHDHIAGTRVVREG